MEVAFFHPLATLFLNIYSSIYLCRLYLFSTTTHQRVFWAWLSIKYPWRYLYFSADTIATLIEMYVANIKYISPSGPHFIQLVSSLHPLSPLASCYCPSFHFPPLRSGEEGRPFPVASRWGVTHNTYLVVCHCQPRPLAQKYPVYVRHVCMYGCYVRICHI